jgi:hypothetical protein
VSKLRKSLGESAIETRDPGYVMRGELDADQFQALVASARQAEPERAAELLREALSLWRGTALCDVDLPLERARLEEQKLAAIEQRIDATSHAAARRAGRELEALVTEHPLREPYLAQLMLALYRAGRQAEALEAYRRGRSHLMDELGIDPSPRLQQLEQAILRQDDALTIATDERTLTATAVFLDLGIRGEVEAVSGRALTIWHGGARPVVRPRRTRPRRCATRGLPRRGRGDQLCRACARAPHGRARRCGASTAGLATADLTLADRVQGVAVVLAARRVRSAKDGEIVVGERTAASAHAHAFTRRGDGYVFERSLGSGFGSAGGCIVAPGIGNGRGFGARRGSSAGVPLEAGAGDSSGKTSSSASPARRR